MKHLLITGCNGELGRKIVGYFLEQRFAIIGIDKRAPRSSIKSEDNLNMDYMFYTCDLNDENEVKKLFRQNLDNNIFDAVIFLHGFIHSKMIFNPATGEELKLSEWDDVINSNLRSTFIVTREILNKHLKSRSPISLIYVSSISRKGLIGQAAYSSAKAGVEAFSKVISKEYGKLGVRSNSISPGFIETDNLQTHITENRLKYIKENSSSLKSVEPDDVIKAINFLLFSQGITGVDIEINNGLDIR